MFYENVEVPDVEISIQTNFEEGVLQCVFTIIDFVHDQVLFNVGNFNIDLPWYDGGEVSEWLSAVTGIHL
jgi:hypothetical protein